MKKLTAIATCLALLLLVSGGEVAAAGTAADNNIVSIFIDNKCPFPIWPATAPNTGHQVLANGGFYLPSNHITQITSPSDWSGRIWARTRCNFNHINNTNNHHPSYCQTGDCSGLLACNGKIGKPPATLIEITLNPPPRRSYYDVSLVDGYNLPVSVDTKPAVPECGIRGCYKDLNRECPHELSVVDENDGDVVACKSGCLGFNDDRFCCRGKYGSADKCKPSVYSLWFKNACPCYFSYAFDKPSPLVSCVVKELVISFCPSRWGGGRSYDDGGDSSTGDEDM